MYHGRLVAAFRWLTASAVLAGIVLVYSRWLHANQTTVALTLLLLILALAAKWSLRYALVISLAATLAYNYFFLPPIGTIAIADAQNWLALFAFLATALIGSRLSQRARDEADEMRARQREVEFSLQLSRELLQLDDVGNLVNALPMLVNRVTGASSTVLYLLDGDRLFQHGTATWSEVEIPHLRQLSLTLREVDDSQVEETRIPLMAGVRPRGLLTLRGVVLSRQSLQTIGGLVSIALDRAQALEDVAKNEANKESERLRTLIIDSITHELRTPLTSIKGAASSMISSPDMQAETRMELLEVIDEESDRINLLVSRATEMAQLDSQQVHMSFHAVDVDVMLEDAKTACASSFAHHPISVATPPLPKVTADSEFIGKVLCNLLENAAKYSVPGTPIFLSAQRQGNEVLVNVADRGYGIDSSEQALIFDRFYRARSHAGQVTGTGMGLAISKAIIEAHGGTLSVTSQLGQGSVFTFTLPVDAGGEHARRPPERVLGVAACSHDPSAAE